MFCNLLIAIPTNNQGLARRIIFVLPLDLHQVQSMWTKYDRKLENESLITAFLQGMQSSVIETRLKEVRERR